MKRIFGLILVLIIMMSVMVGCDYSQSADEKQTQATSQLLNQMNNKIGMPNIKEFYEKEMAKEIYELRDDSKLVCYAYTQAMDGKFIYLGKCMGFGLPYSTQYTNPQQYTRIRPNASYGETGVASYGDVTMPQPEPNGLFMPDSASATWLMMINPDTGEREVMYVEPNTVVTQSKLPKRLVEEWSLSKDY